MPGDIWDGLIDAINSRQAADLAKVLDPDVHIDVYGVDQQRDVVVRNVSGHSQAFEWLDRSPQATVFERAEAPNDDPLQARYRVKVLYFEGGGSWQGELAEDGRLRRLDHRPDDLADIYRAAPPTEQTPEDQADTSA